MKSTITLLITFSLLSALAAIACIHFVDKEIALGIWKITSSHPDLHKNFENIPNTLPILVAISSALMWVACYVAVQMKSTNSLLKFLQLSATAIPAAFLIKIVLQQTFGRTNIRLWFRIGGPIEFRWFDPVEGGGFPSGHTIVFTAFFTAIWMYYPKYRPLVVTALAGLTMALLATNSHFVSDILAGICCGILITVSIHHLFSRSLAPSKKDMTPKTPHLFT